MSKFEFPPSILSRPVWGTLQKRPGQSHLMIAEAEGAEAILDIATPELMGHTHLIYSSPKALILVTSCAP